MGRELKSILVVSVFVFFIICCPVQKAGAGDDNPDSVFADAKITGSITGDDGKPVAGAYVYAYKTTMRGQMGPADFISNPTDEKGGFLINVKAGEYFIIARKRADGSNVGVLSTGDYSSQTGTKVSVATGADFKLDLNMKKIVEPMFFKMAGTEVTKSGIKGVILDKHGKAVTGAFAVAYTDPKMKTLPKYASAPVQADGAYTLYLPNAGDYYIAARVKTKKPPVEGEYFGTYDGNDTHLVTVREGSFVKSVDITLKPFSGIAQTDFKGFE